MNTLRQLRKKRGFTQGELAKRAGIQASTLSNIERAKPGFVRYETVVGLARALDVPMVTVAAAIEAHRPAEA